MFFLFIIFLPAYFPEYTIMQFVRNIGDAFGGLYADAMSVIAPRVCPVCGTVLTEAEECLCGGCLSGLEYTGYENIPGNPMELRLEHIMGGPMPAAALLVYTHGQVSGRMVSSFKYSGEKDLAVYAGQMLGAALSGSGRFADYDLLVPVPLHPKKWKRRGYNQAEEICRGMSGVCGLAVGDVLKRTVFTQAQASLDKWERLRNTRGIFALKEGEPVVGKKIIVVDDVFTTGATVSAAAQVLSDAGAAQVAVACLCAG